MTPRRVGDWFVGLFGLAILAAVTAGLVLSGSPGEARRVRLDERRIERLMNLESALRVVWMRDGRLPSTLDSLVTPGGPTVDLRDPETGAPFGYTAFGGGRCELCATFAAASAEGPRAYDVRWAHPAGRHCFVLEFAVPAGPR